MKEFYRTATSKEIKLYRQELYSFQDNIFQIAALYED